MAPLNVPAELLTQTMPEQHILFTYIGYGLCVVAIVAALYVAKLHRTLIPLGLLIGGGLCVLFEPIVDVLGKAWFPIEGQWSAIEAFGRAIPHFLLTSYFWYVGGQAVYIFHRLMRGASARELWITYPVFALVNFVLEYSPNHDLFQTYYGNQPFVVFMMPLWWLVVNPLMPIIAGCIAFSIRNHLRGAALPLSILITPLADGIANGGCAWPVWIALNSNVGLAVTHAAALVTLTLACSVMWFVSRMATTPASNRGSILEP
jgi:hypothetical protein